MARRALRAHAHCVRCLALLPLALFSNENKREEHAEVSLCVSTLHTIALGAHRSRGRCLQAVAVLCRCVALTRAALAAASHLEWPNCTKRNSCVHKGVSRRSTHAVDFVLFLALEACHFALCDVHRPSPKFVDFVHVAPFGKIGVGLCGWKFC